MDVIIEGPTTVTLEFRILIKTIKSTFQLDEEFEFKTVDGRIAMVRFSLAFSLNGIITKISLKNLFRPHIV